METMVSIKSHSDALAHLGTRLRAARLARDEPMAMFARRIGVSVPTLRQMETGAPTVAIGYWVEALTTLGRVQELDAILAPAGGLLERAREARRPQRLRARRVVRSGE